MVRDLIDALRSSATDRRGPMWPAGNGDETQWALDCCLLGQHHFVSLPEITELKPRPHPMATRCCPPSRWFRRGQLPNRSAAPEVEVRLGRPPPPGTYAGFLSTQQHRRRLR